MTAAVKTGAGEGVCLDMSNGHYTTTRAGRFFTRSGDNAVNYILLYKVKKKVKAMIKDKLALGELATTPSSCLDCLATDISWEIYYLMKEKDES
jgi:hypothetical protein